MLANQQEITTSLLVISIGFNFNKSQIQGIIGKVNDVISTALRFAPLILREETILRFRYFFRCPKFFKKI